MADNSPTPQTLPLTIEFTGGLELLFSNQRRHFLSLPFKNENDAPANMAFLIRYLCERLLKDRRMDMFVVDGAV
ncbi:Ubiquitin- modifier 1 [Trapelia coarctata]|nr:Ubiquitin- modifier 1 [Trapelia coarctata]